MNETETSGGISAVSVPSRDVTIDWLRALAQDGGKGVVGNIDARCLGRIADRLEQQDAEIERLRAALTEIEEYAGADDLDSLDSMIAIARRALEEKS